MPNADVFRMEVDFGTDEIAATLLVGLRTAFEKFQRNRGTADERPTARIREAIESLCGTAKDEATALAECDRLDDSILADREDAARRRRTLRSVHGRAVIAAERASANGGSVAISWEILNAWARELELLSREVGTMGDRKQPNEAPVGVRPTPSYPSAPISPVEESSS